MTQLDTVERVALALGAVSTLLGIVGLGIVEILAGQPYGAAPTTNEAGEVVATPAVDPAVRTGLVIVGLVVLFGLGLYRMVTDGRAATDGQTRVTAD
ncbi:hypothetical protein [Candidatus Halobonum tyrrellensis]|uniref:Cox cluster protein n=1 Tax=Candidatus Halobonum tyrrellensis G22 TaxID=1324957 RepID=V4HB41_9EURY|nr:hypothetical protein [Candidatus Halobonum tyrrellensis]ESP87910.1 hypothetical protein K933_11356 [Candidatus Halobonum tyrrellensis G22]